MSYHLLLLPLVVILFSVLAYKKWSPILLGPFMALILTIAVQFPVFETMLGPYMETSAGFVKSFFFVFLLGAIFGAIMEETGAAHSIAVWMSGKTKGKYILPLIMTIAGILAYGGVSGFVVYFAMYPIALFLCQEANISRALIPGAIASGCWTWAMTAPGAPSIPNIIAGRSLGTPPTSDFWAGFFCSGVLLYVLCFAYLEWQGRVYQRKGLGFVPDVDVIAFSDENGKLKMPKPIIAFLPIIMILVLFNLFRVQIEFALLAGIFLSMLLMYKNGGDRNIWLNMFNTGAKNSTVIILNTALVVGFAGVMRNTIGFNQLIELLKGASMSPLVFVAVTSALAAAAAASASGGMGVAMEAFKEIYLSFGVPLEWIHRVAVVSGGTFDSLPHTGGQVSLLNICKQTHKEAYWHMFVTECIFPCIAVAALILWHAIWP